MTKLKLIKTLSAATLLLAGDLTASGAYAAGDFTLNIKNNANSEIQVKCTSGLFKVWDWFYLAPGQEVHHEFHPRGLYNPQAAEFICYAKYLINDDNDYHSLAPSSSFPSIENAAAFISKGDQATINFGPLVNHGSVFYGKVYYVDVPISGYVVSHQVARHYLVYQTGTGGGWG